MLSNGFALALRIILFVVKSYKLKGGTTVYQRLINIGEGKYQVVSVGGKAIVLESNENKSTKNFSGGDIRKNREWLMKKGTNDKII